MSFDAQQLSRDAEQHQSLPGIHHAFCDRLLADGLPIWRSSLGLEVLHPEMSGTQFRWIASETTVEVAQRGLRNMQRYETSPVKIVDDTDKTYRRRLRTPIADMPLLEELRQSGATDYIIIPLPFVDRSRSAYISFATREASGFSDQELDRLEEAARLFSPYAERLVLRRLAIDLLDVYLGHRSGERVFSGAIERGAVETIRAVICMGDLRGFTRFSDEQPISSVIAALNEFFGVLVDAISSEGGEVLKFMGDALLAIFPAVDGDLGPSSEAAMRALRGIGRGMGKLNESRAAAGEPVLAFGLALHAGEVAYGNIGGRTRLDFTVIGPAVNHTSRILELSKKINRPVLISGAFAERCAAPLLRLGKFRLRDVSRSHDVFIPQETIAPDAD